MLRSRNYISHTQKRLVVAENVLKVLKVLHNSVGDSKSLFSLKIRDEINANEREEAGGNP